MTLRRHFNRLATGLVFGLSLGCATSTGLSANPSETNSNLVPAGKTPSFIAEAYEKLSGVKSRPRDPATFSIRTSVTSLTDLPDNPWLHQLKALAPAAAEQTVRPCLKTLCAENFAELAEPEKTIGQIVVLEAMFHNGLNQEEHKTYAEYLKDFEPDERMKETDERIIAETTAAIRNSEEYRNIRARLIPVAQITPHNKAEQFHLRLDFMKFVADKLRRNYSVEPIHVYLDEFPAPIANTVALNIPVSYVKNIKKPFILVNYTSKAVNNIDDIILYLSHEVRHSIDNNITMDLRKKTFTREDQRFTHAAVTTLNDNAYINACAAITPPPGNCTQQYAWYRNQYKERSAFDFSDKFLKKLKQGSEVEPAPPQTSYRLEPQKLQLPS